jgi:signal transduction histidine kinase
LTFKLTLALLAVSIVGAGLTALFARWATYREFDRLVLQQAQEHFVTEAATYYQAQGSWIGFGRYLQTRVSVAPSRDAPGARLLNGQRPPPSEDGYVFALADATARIVLAAGDYGLGAQVPASDLAGGMEIIVGDEVVGTALITGVAPELAPQESHYLRRTNLSSLYAVLAASAVALLLGVLLTRPLTRPLREMTAASRAMARGDLEQRVPVRSRDELGELAGAFNLMSTGLARAHEQRRQMTADIAHDLRTPLTVLSGYLEALRDGVLAPSTERFDTMHQEAKYLNRLVDDLRTLSLADAGELTLNQEPVAPLSLLEQVQTRYFHQAVQQGITLRTSPPAGCPLIYADPDRLIQVLGNLVSNALRHTPAGGRITLSVARQVDQVVLSVEDTGVGIAPDDLPHIFDRFYRGASARDGDGAESGLGLAIAKSLVELHGGAITVGSRVGVGTRFSIRLPATGSVQSTS